MVAQTKNWLPWANGQPNCRTMTAHLVNHWDYLPILGQEEGCIIYSASHRYCKNGWNAVEGQVYNSWNLYSNWFPKWMCHVIKSERLSAKQSVLLCTKGLNKAPPKNCLFALTQPTATSELTHNGFFFFFFFFFFFNFSLFWDFFFPLEINIFWGKNIPESIHRE